MQASMVGSFRNAVPVQKLPGTPLSCHAKHVPQAQYTASLDSPPLSHLGLGNEWSRRLVEESSRSSRFAASTPNRTPERTS